MNDILDFISKKIGKVIKIQPNIIKLELINSFKIYLFFLLIFTNFMICSSQAIHLYDSSLDGNQIYYVDSTNGSDDNNGFSEGAAWQSIGKVNQSTFLPGDRILFKSGQEFFGKLIPPSSGDSSNLIILVIAYTPFLLSFRMNLFFCTNSC